MRFETAGPVVVGVVGGVGTIVALVMGGPELVWTLWKDDVFPINVVLNGIGMLIILGVGALVFKAGERLHDLVVGIRQRKSSGAQSAGIRERNRHQYKGK